LAGGAAMGAVILTAYYWIGRFQSDGAAIFFENILETSFRVFFPYFFLWMFWLTFIGIPSWLLAHFTGLRTWGASLIVGFSIPFIIVFILNLKIGNEMRISIWTAIGHAALFALPGALAALTIWFIAYRRPTPC
ncbi:MAG: hypothetical protein GQ535_01100, partial [Rhodobacteraceae bacterium]|nr:hypothetical protein [Paracoccaceae bacterium]